MIGVTSCRCQSRHVRLGSAHRRLGPSSSVVQPVGPKRCTVPPVACTFDDMQGYPSVETGIEEPDSATDTRLPVTVCHLVAPDQSCVLVVSETYSAQRSQFPYDLHTCASQSFPRGASLYVVTKESGYESKSAKEATLGKTTLLNHILSQDHGKKIAVIENEFGDIAIDDSLIRGKETLSKDSELASRPEDVELTILENGCLCCTVRGDLVLAVANLVERGGFDHIVIETTGIANPAPIISTFLLEPSLAEKVRLDGICTVVDTKHVSMHLDRKEDSDDDEGVDQEAMDQLMEGKELMEPEGKGGEAAAQIAYADRIVLNKTDLVTDDELKALEARIRNMNRLATIQRTVKSKVSTDYVLGIGGYALEHVSAQVENELDSLSQEARADEHSHDHDKSKAHAHDHSHDSHSHDHEHSHAHGDGEEEHCDDCGHSHAPGEHDHDHVHHKNIHDDSVTSASFVIKGEMDLQKLNLWLGALLEMRGEDIYRMKGILNIKFNKERFVFQGVHNMFEGTPDREWADGEERLNKMVFIGKNLEMELLREGFEDCLHIEGEDQMIVPEEAVASA